MQTTPYVDALLADLESMAALGDEAVADAARRLSQTLRASAGLRLLDLLGEAALEVSGQLPSGIWRAATTCVHPAVIRSRGRFSAASAITAYPIPTSPPPGLLFCIASSPVGL